MGPGSRWGVAVTGSLACFGGCWAGLAGAHVLDTGTQVGVAAVPLALVLAVLGAWAERARERQSQATGPGKATINADAPPQAQVTGQVTGGVVIGPGASLVNPVFNPSAHVDDGKEPVRDTVTVCPSGTLVVGDVPQEPAAFQLRPGLIESLDWRPGARISVVFAVTGIRGVGKTQIAAAYARQRIIEGWRLVAWVDASRKESLHAGLARVAVAAGIGEPEGHVRVAPHLLAERVRPWLEADGNRRLVVFDNAADFDVLRPFLPAAGGAQAIVTSSRRSVAGLGSAVPVDVFTEREAVKFLKERTGLQEESGALELARELGFLPLGLAQAAALIVGQHLDYGRYLARLRALPVAQYLERVEGDAYPYRLAEAIILSLRGVEEADPSGNCARVIGWISVLAETGVSRRMLYATLGENEAAEMDAIVGRLADASLVGFSVDDSIVAHRLVMRVVRERLEDDGKLLAARTDAVRLVSLLFDSVIESGRWSDRTGVQELGEQLNALSMNTSSKGNDMMLAWALLEMRWAYTSEFGV